MNNVCFTMVPTGIVNHIDLDNYTFPIKRPKSGIVLCCSCNNVIDKNTIFYAAYFTNTNTINNIDRYYGETFCCLTCRQLLSYIVNFETTYIKDSKIGYIYNSGESSFHNGFLYHDIIIGESDEKIIKKFFGYKRFQRKRKK